MNTPMITTQGDSIVEMQELRNKDDCFRISYTDQSELVIEFYNGAKLDAIFQSKIPSKMFESLFGIDSISYIYDYVIETIKKIEYNIKDMNGEKKLFLRKDKVFTLRKILDNCFFASIFKKILAEKNKKIAELSNRIEV
jgi:DNA repair exonuclease SbcCD ATPase subunit